MVELPTAVATVRDALNPSLAKVTSVTATAAPSNRTVKSDPSGAPETASVKRSVIVVLPASVVREIIYGAVVSIRMALPSPREPIAPMAGNVKVAAFPAKSFMVPAKAEVET